MIDYWYSGINKEDAQFFPIRLKRTCSINDFIDTARNMMTPTAFFKYDSFGSNGGNCQMFVLDLLSANGLLDVNPGAKEFIDQNAVQVAESLNPMLKSFMRGVTDLGGLVNVAVEGRGEWNTIGRDPDATNAPMLRDLISTGRGYETDQEDAAFKLRLNEKAEFEHLSDTLFRYYVNKEKEINRESRDGIISSEEAQDKITKLYKEVAAKSRSLGRIKFEPQHVRKHIKQSLEHHVDSILNQITGSGWQDDANNLMATMNANIAARKAGRVPSGGTFGDLKIENEEINRVMFELLRLDGNVKPKFKRILYLLHENHYSWDEIDKIPDWQNIFISGMTRLAQSDAFTEKLLGILEDLFTASSNEGGMLHAGTFVTNIHNTIQFFKDDEPRTVRLEGNNTLVIS